MSGDWSGSLKSDENTHRYVCQTDEVNLSVTLSFHFWKKNTFFKCLCEIKYKSSVESCFDNGWMMDAL